MTRYTLHVPEHYNNGDPVSSEYFAEVEARIEDVAGGWTLTHGIGGWLGDDGRYREPVRLYAMDVDDLDALRASIALRGLAQKIARELDQEAVYLTAQEIAPTLVYATAAV